MKVKNIMFAGFAAAIFASVAGAANAAATYELASKQYVDAEISAEVERANEAYDVKGAAKTAEDNAKAYTDDEIAAEVARADLAYDAKGAAATAETNAKAYTDGLTGDVATLKTDATLKYAKEADDLTAAVKKLDAAISVASGNLDGVYTKAEADELLADKVDQRQDVANAGKGLIVNSEGVLAIADVATDAELSDAIKDLDVEQVTDANGFISSVSETDGKVTAGTTAFIDNVANNATSTIAPQTAAVKTYVDNQNALDVKKADANLPRVADAAGFISSVSQTNGTVAASTTLFEETVSDDSTSVVAPQTKAVATYVNSKIAEVNEGAKWLDKTAAEKGDYIVRVDENGNESLINVVVVDANGEAIYPAPAAN